MNKSPEFEVHTRREFCSRACMAASFLAAGAIVGCGGGPASPSSVSAPPLASVNATVAGRLVSIALDGAAALTPVGSAALVRTSLGAFLVAHTGQDTYTALNATCTHESNTVTGFADGRYVCTFHGSQFTTSGSVASGPANRALTQYPTQVSGTTLTFTV
ncbi:MAG: Rieske (2Fe-2S) protein [Vicinamibacterales bacterium]